MYGIFKRFSVFEWLTQQQQDVLPQGIDLFGPEGSLYEYGELVLKTNNKQIHVRYLPLISFNIFIFLKLR